MVAGSWTKMVKVGIQGPTRVLPPICGKDRHVYAAKRIMEDVAKEFGLGNARIEGMVAAGRGEGKHDRIDISLAGEQDGDMTPVPAGELRRENGIVYRLLEGTMSDQMVSGGESFIRINLNGEYKIGPIEYASIEKVVVCDANQFSMRDPYGERILEGQVVSMEFESDRLGRVDCTKAVGPEDKLKGFVRKVLSDAPSCEVRRWHGIGATDLLHKQADYRPPALESFK